jgi:hypothetical protein
VLGEQFGRELGVPAENRIVGAILNTKRLLRGIDCASRRVGLQSRGQATPRSRVLLIRISPLFGSLSPSRPRGMTGHQTGQSTDRRDRRPEHRRDHFRRVL